MGAMCQDFNEDEPSINALEIDPACLNVLSEGYDGFVRIWPRFTVVHQWILSMLSTFVLVEGRVVQSRIEHKEDLNRKDIIWVDLAYPTDAERALVQSVFPLELPDDEELQDLQGMLSHSQPHHHRICTFN
jgi:Mg2+ and Co2+ transporter CorA